MNAKKNRILVVDDDPDIGIMIKLMLEYHGYNVVVTERAEKAEDLISEEHFDLLIMDMLLSGKNGTDICAKLKKDEALARLPIIMFSAHPNAKEICLGAGADDFIFKPFDMDELLTKIDGFFTVA
jgi:DNA-binding response OmpR family regulator